MSEAEKNAALARRWFDEVWNKRSDSTVHELLHIDAAGHLESGDSRGVAEFLATRAFILGAFPDLRIVVEEMAAQGASVAVRWSVKGTHRGEFLGIAASAAPVDFRGITWLRFADGQIVEGWDAWNQGRLLTELQAAVERRSRAATDHAVR